MGGHQLVQTHPQSLSAREKFFGTPLVIFNELVQTERIYIRGISPVPPLAVLVFAGALSHGIVSTKSASQNCGDAEVIVGRWMTFSMSKKTKNAIFEIRAHLQGLWKSTLKSASTREAADHRALQSSVLFPLADLLALPMLPGS